MVVSDLIYNTFNRFKLNLNLYLIIIIIIYSLFGTVIITIQKMNLAILHRSYYNYRSFYTSLKKDD